MLALVLALGATPLAVYADEGEGTTQSETSNVNEDSEGTGETNTAKTVNATPTSLNAGQIRVTNIDENIDTIYSNLGDAVKNAPSGSTIELSAGTYSLYSYSANPDALSDRKQNPTNPDWQQYIIGKSLTFVGHSADDTFWNIGTPYYDAGGEANGDYSFDGANVITFKNLTLQSPVQYDGTLLSSQKNYTGFIRPNETIVEDCVINGRTAYWGYQTATFRNTTFNCPFLEYAIWTYSSPVMTFDNCTFNSTGKVINVYADFEAGKHDITVNFNGCTVNGWSLKQVLNINDYNMGDYKYVINISGDNVVNGVNVNTDKITCSRLFGYSGDTSHNTGRTIVNFGNTPVWQGGKMVDVKAYHNSGVTADGVTYNNNVDGSNNSLYAEGYKDNAFDTTTSEWTTNPDGTITRNVTKKCKYCGHEENVTEHQGKLTYDANGGEGAIDSATGAAGENVTVAENVFTRNNYTFTGWNTQADGKGTAYKPGDSFTLTDEDTVLYAQWSENAPAQVNVSYDANGGTGTMESITGDVGSEIVIGQNGFARSGYTFTGWNTQADGKGTAYKPGDSFTLTDEDIVLYAQWNKLVTVSFDLCGHGGANIPSQTFVSGNKASEPTAPKEDGWVFGGWYTEKGCQYRFSFDSAVTSDITLYAKWDRVTTVVSAPVATPTPSPASAAAATKTATVKNAAIPQTSDVFPMEGLLALLAVGAVGFGAAGWLRKKHH